MLKQDYQTKIFKKSLSNNQSLSTLETVLVHITRIAQGALVEGGVPIQSLAVMNRFAIPEMSALK